MVVNVNAVAALDPIIARLDDFVTQNMPDVDAKYTKIENGPPLNHPVEIRITGNDTDALFEIAENVKAKLKTLSGARNIKDDWGQRIKKLIVRIDQARAWRAGVTSRDVAISMQAALR
jgi:multidrug efflux pump subunit AcrB